MIGFCAFANQNCKTKRHVTEQCSSVRHYAYFIKVWSLTTQMADRCEIRTNKLHLNSKTFQKLTSTCIQGQKGVAHDWALQDDRCDTMTILQVSRETQKGVGPLSRQDAPKIPAMCPQRFFCDLQLAIRHPKTRNYTTETDRLSRIKSGSCVALWQQHESWVSDYAQCRKFVISHSALHLVFVWFYPTPKRKPFNRGLRRSSRCQCLSFLDQRQTLLFLLITSLTANCGPICQIMTPS